MATLERKLGRRDGVRFAITWLHARAKEMNDPTAVAVLNVAASDLGNMLSRTEVVELSRPEKRIAPDEGLKEPVRKFEDTFSGQKVIMDHFFPNATGTKPE